MNTSLTEEEKQIILQAESNRVSGGIYSEDGHRLLKVLGHQEHFEVKYGVTTICDGALGYHAYLRDVVLPTSVVNVDMFFFLCGILIVVFGGYILISLIQLVFMIIGWIIQAIFSMFE